MTFEIEAKLNDGLGESPPVTVEVSGIEELLSRLLALDTFTNDYGVPMPVGATVRIERKS